MFRILLAAVVGLTLSASAASAQTVRHTKQAAEWTKKNPDKKLVKFVLPDKKEAYVFEGDYHHEGVSLTSQQVIDIQADQVMEKAEKWVAEWNKNPDNPIIRLAGIEYIGHKQGSWEDKGEKKDSFGISRGRYHKFGGTGRANILIYP